MPTNGKGGKGKGSSEGNSVGKGKGKGYTRCASEEPSEVPTKAPAADGAEAPGSTDSKDTSKDDSTDIDPPADPVCVNIANTDYDADVVLGDSDKEFDVVVKPDLTSAMTTDEFKDVLDDLDIIVSLYVAGCEDDANAAYEELIDARFRRLLSRELLADADVEYVGLGDWEVGK
jgi:hypothetical protein